MAALAQALGIGGCQPAAGGKPVDALGHGQAVKALDT
jgi:hypothetical protein